MKPVRMDVTRCHRIFGNVITAASLIAGCSSHGTAIKDDVSHSDGTAIPTDDDSASLEDVVRRDVNVDDVHSPIDSREVAGPEDANPLIDSEEPDAGGSLAFDPAYRFGPEPAPEAEIIDNLTFEALTQLSGFQWDTPGIRAEQEAARAAQHAADVAAISGLAATESVYARLVAPVAPGVVAREDGNYTIALSGDGDEASTVVAGKATQMRTALSSRARYEAPDNQLRAYAQAWEALDVDVRASLPSPDSLSAADAATLRAARATLSTRVMDVADAFDDARPLPEPLITASQGPSEPPNSPSIYLEEEGHGSGSDKSKWCYIPNSPNGLFKNFWWPQKYFHTSTKDNGDRRETSVAFALAGALESIVAIEQGRWINLSEQFLWSQIASVWDPRWFGDGADVIDQAVKLYLSGWGVPLEEEWRYNPSSSRFTKYVEGGNPKLYYVKSCVPDVPRFDTDYCSNSSAQRRHYCTKSGVSFFCGYVSKTPTVDGETFKGREPIVLHDASYYADHLSGIPLEEIRLALKSGAPVIASVDTVFFANVAPFDESGFVLAGTDAIPTYHYDWGSSTALITGYIPSLAILAHPTLDEEVKATAATSGGFLVLKTSICVGDDGYVYLAVNAAKDILRSIVTWKTTPGPLFTESKPNLKPVIKIVAPLPDETWGEEDTKHLIEEVVLFEAETSDPDSVKTPAVVWSSDVDGPLGSGESIEVAFATPGPRVITATATDKKGATATDTITITATNLSPIATITSPLPEATVYVGDTVVVVSGSASDQDGAMLPFSLPCTSLSWSSSNPDDIVGSGCSFTVTFETLGTRTLTLTATDAFGASATDSVLVSVIEKPLSGPPVVTITKPTAGESFDPAKAITLAFTVSDPGASENVKYPTVWQIEANGISKTTITTKTCQILGLTLPCFTPAEYGFTNSGAKEATLTVTVTDQEGLTGTDSVNIIVGIVQ